MRLKHYDFSLYNGAVTGPHRNPGLSIQTQVTTTYFMCRTTFPSPMAMARADRPTSLVARSAQQCAGVQQGAT